jgi:L-alanine-DL-glutamate epimerase-like enolase superfamily enzyme
VARQVLGRDPVHIDALIDRVIDANMKFPWSYVCRALSGVDTAVWDLYGKLQGKPVCALLGGKLVVPHSSHLSLITVFSLHFMAAIPNAGPVVEFSIEGDANAGEALYSPALKVVDGKVKIPDGPGWGVKINPAWLEKANYLKSEKTS